MKNIFSEKTSLLANSAMVVAAQNCADGYCSGGGSGMMGGYGSSSWMGNWFGFGGLGFLVLVFLIVVIVVILYLVRYMSYGGKIKLHEDDALEILKKRFAKGEITKEYFDRMKQDLDKM